MSDELYDVPSNSMKAREEEKAAEKQTDRPGITPRKKGLGSFFRQMVNKGDVDSITNIFGNAMINAVGDTIDEVTGNLTHRAKSILYGTEDYDRGRNRRNSDRYNSYSKYYEERNGRSRPSGASGSRNTNRSEDSGDRSMKKWKYNDVFFDQRIFGGKRGAELAAWRVIKALDEQISDPDVECVSVADLFRACKEEDPQNPMLVPEFTDERWGWTDEDIIRNLQPIAVPGGYIIELPKPKSFYN